MITLFVIMFIILILIARDIANHIISTCMFPKLTHTYTQNDIRNPLTHFINIDNTIGYFLFNGHYSYTILYSHGNGSDIGQQREWCWELHETLHMNILAYDYIGYGLSVSRDGEIRTPSEDGCYSSADLAMKFLTQVKGIPVQNIILMGHSLGTGVTCEMATRYRTAGVLLMAPFTSALGVVSPLVANIFPVMDRMRSIDKIQDIEQPIKIIHGVRDRVIRYESALDLQRQNPDNVEVALIEQGNHVNLATVASHHIYEALRSFTTITTTSNVATIYSTLSYQPPRAF